MDDAPDDRPRSLRDPLVLAQRRAMLDAPHMRPILAEIGTLRQRPGVVVPDADPLDGGAGARMLFLLEKPGPMTDPNRAGRRRGSGFVSRDNDDPTAEATWQFMAEAGIPRRMTLIWNVIPWWNGTIDIRRGELDGGLEATARLIGLLPALRGVVLVGRKAGRAQPLLAGRGLHVATSPHPSPQVRAAFPAMWRLIGAAWREAGRQAGCLPG